MTQTRTKIVCTIGPATWEPEVMRKLIENGMTVARVNGAFADKTELDKVAKLVRDISSEVALMVDVKGPEVRLNKFPEAISLQPGQRVTIGSTQEHGIYPANYPDLYQHIQPGQRIVIGDGDTELRVLEVADGKMECEVVYGEILKPGKAMNLPGADIATEVLTDKDKENLRHAIETGWDFVSASFIQSADAARYVKDFMGETTMRLVAKIEDQEGLDNIDEILQVVDGIMIARGGLGVELGLQKVPLAQKMLIEKCNNLGKPVITATQMLESMIEKPRPTRAEVSDVATAILAGTDAVMLSGESSAGEYPIEAVSMLSKIASEVEPSISHGLIEARAIAALNTDAFTRAAADMCITLKDEISAVILVSYSGTAARLFCRHNVKKPVFVFTKSQENVRALSLSKGVTQAYQFDGIESKGNEYSRRNAVYEVVEIAIASGVITKGEKVLFVGKTPLADKAYFPNVLEVVNTNELSH